MRLMIRGDSETQVTILAKAVAANLDAPLLIAADTVTLEKTPDFVLQARLGDLDAARTLDARLDTVGLPLDLVLSIRSEPRATDSLPTPDPDSSPIDAHYAERGILRRIQGAACGDHIFAAVIRILAQQSKSSTGFDEEWLPALTPAAAAQPPSASPAQTPTPSGHPPPPSSEASSSGWRKSAEQQGRIKRRSTVVKGVDKRGKPSRKPRRS